MSHLYRKATCPRAVPQTCGNNKSLLISHLRLCTCSIKIYIIVYIYKVYKVEVYTTRFISHSPTVKSVTIRSVEGLSQCVTGLRVSLCG